MSDQIIIDWHNFGFHIGTERRVKRVKTKTGGTALANMGVEAKISHRNFLTKEETEVLVEATGRTFRHSTPKQVASGNFGRFTLEINGVGRFFTDHSVGEIKPYILPDEVAGAGRGFTPIVAYERLVKKVDVESYNAKQNGKFPIESVVEVGLAKPVPVERQLTHNEVVDDAESNIPSGGLLDGNEEGLVVDNEPIVDENDKTENTEDSSDEDSLYKD